MQLVKTWWNPAAPRPPLPGQLVMKKTQEQHWEEMRSELDNLLIKELQDGPKKTKELCEKFGLSRSRTLKRLNRLHESGVVELEKCHRPITGGYQFVWSKK